MGSFIAFQGHFCRHNHSHFPANVLPVCLYVCLCVITFANLSLQIGKGLPLLSHSLLLPLKVQSGFGGHNHHRQIGIMGTHVQLRWTRYPSVVQNSEEEEEDEGKPETRIIIQDHYCYANFFLYRRWFQRDAKIRHRMRLCGDQHVLGWLWRFVFCLPHLLRNCSPRVPFMCLSILLLFLRGHGSRRPLTVAESVIAYLFMRVILCPPSTDEDVGQEDHPNQTMLSVEFHQRHPLSRPKCPSLPLVST